MTDRAYLRISLDTLASGSIAKQRAALTKAADGEPVFYADESVSGSKVPFAKRPEGARLLSDLHAGDRVLVTKLDRMGRNTEDVLATVRRITEAGASVRFTEQDIDTSGPVGQLLLTILAAVAQMEAAMIAERRRESLVAFKAEGRHAVGEAPFGLQSAPNPTGRGLVLRPHPEEAPALREAVERLYAGTPLSTLAADLGILDTRLGRVLRNERLAGVLEQTPDGPRLDPDMAVFTLVEWDRLQKHLTSRPVKTWTPSEGIGAALSCSECGDRLYFNAAKVPTEATYRCRGVAANHKEGGRPRAAVTAHNAEARVESLFLDAMGDLPVTITVTEESDAARTEGIALARMRLKAAEEALSAAKTREEHLAATDAHWDALEAVEAAKALPVQSFSVVKQTGETFADLYARGGADRVNALQLAGRWVVSPGRLPLADKVRFFADADLWVEANDGK
ncbi:invertase [Intrasporangium oryzae NRRL B-24470]|uniref:Invertase n=1 Tax=Intrasporangium oryzae NRRL B-24470 TaxID=1386089 RepID=W9GAQ2_9MICO|nr:recombinase family protein [Intrasporangium oryzae]EWT00949.1 invertase [Intrasporangium oryzae NRRL B-24470]